jgi:formamidopyrimidine-DNA glycosylase
MPELPEVETVRRQIAPRATGRRVAELQVLDALWCAPGDPRELERGAAGRRIESVGRRGKYLVWSLDGDVHLVMHLRMTGNLLYSPSPDVPYARVRIRLDDGNEVVFTDPRRFGTGILLQGADALEEHLASRVGVEPLSKDFTAERLRELARGRRAPVKAFLLDQRHVAGVGNIYADEALHRAGIHPLRPAGKLRPAQLADLRDAVVATLSAGIDSRGATIDDFRDPDGARGSFQDRFRVHRRAGEPCPVCGTPVRKLRAAGRGTYVCERCQPRPRARRPAARTT